MNKIILSKFEQGLINKIRVATEVTNQNAFVIGGFVRDKLIGRDTKDIDIVTTGDGIILAHQFANQFKITPPVNFFKNFGTAQVKLGSTIVEFVGARKESYNPNSRNPSVSPGTLEDDQQRRDFTINALAFDVNQADYNEIIDPFNGIQDLSEGIIRTPVDPKITYNDDPLRMIRAIRFAAQLGFKIETESMQAIKSLANRINIISKERIAVELDKIMLCQKPSIGLRLMEMTGILEILIPQLTDLKGTETIDNIGHKDNFNHTLKVVDNLSMHSDNLWLRYAALFHDIGKTKAKHFDEQHGWTFYGHEFISAKMVKKIFLNLKFPLHDKLQYVQKIVAMHHRPISLTKENITDSAIRRLLFDAGDDIDDLMTMCEADITSKDERKKARYLRNFQIVRERLKEVEEKDQLRNWQPPISGEEIMQTFGLSPSKNVGVIKDAIREAILDGIIENSKRAAWTFMIEFANTKLGLKQK